MTIQGIAATANVPAGATAPDWPVTADQAEDTRRQIDELSRLPALEIRESASCGGAIAVPAVVEFELDPEAPVSDFVEQILSLVAALAGRSVLSMANCRRLSRLAAHVEAVRLAAHDIRPRAR